MMAAKWECVTHIVYKGIITRIYWYKDYQGRDSQCAVDKV